MRSPAMVIGLFAMAAAASPNPCLVFSKPDILKLRERVQAGTEAEVWQRILEAANEYCDSESPKYADPAKVDEMPSGEVRLVVLAHHFGRRLTAWLEAIGFAYQVTGEERFGKHGAALLVAAAERLPVSDPRVAKGFAGARGDIMRALALGYDWLGDALTPEQKRAVEAASAEYVNNMLAEAQRDRTWWVPNHNFMGVGVGAAGLLALNLREARPDEAPGWIEDCAALISNWLDSGFDDQGAYCEGTLYGFYGLSNAVLFAHALLRNGGPDLFANPHVARIPTFYAMSLLPGEKVFDARNDAGYGGASDPGLLRLAGALDSGLAKWLWQLCGSGSSPLRIAWANDVEPLDPIAAGAPLAEHFVGRGLCVFRTGWEEGDVVFSVEAGKFYRGTHNQADKGQFTLYGLGRRWAIDSGYGNNQEPEGTAQTVAHNCILIDGRGQALSGAGLGTNGRILAYEFNASHGYALADCAEAYNKNSRNDAGIGVERALRHVVFVRPSHGAPAYAVVLDDIWKDGAEHDFTWLLHTDPDIEVALEDHGATLRPAQTSGGAYVETPAEPEGQGGCEWELEIAEAGEHIVWARVRAAGEERGKSDSFFVQMDDGEDIPWHMPGRREWAWGKVTSGIKFEPVSFHLEPGTHILRFKTREPQAQVDRVLVTADLSAQPPFLEWPPGHLLEAEAAKIAPPMRIVREEGEGAPPRMKLVLRAAAPLTFDLDAYERHPRLKATVRSVAPEFVALLFPLPGNVADPEIAFERRAEGHRISITWPGRRDALDWPRAADRKPLVTITPVGRQEREGDAANN